MKPVRSVERAISILFLVAQSGQPMGLTEISRLSGIDKATALRLLLTLERAQLVRRDPQTRRYGPGVNVWRLPRSWRSDLRQVSRPYLEALRRATEETVSLICPRGLERVVVEALAAPHELCVVPAVGTTHPIYSGASGKAMMAFMPDGERDRVIALTGLKPITPASITDRGAYLEALRDVRQKGYAFSNSDVTVGASALAAPVFNSEGDVMAAVSLRGPEVRMPSERIATLAPLVMQAANEISGEFGYGPERRESA